MPATSLFDKLPDQIFRPLAATNRRFYAALLLHLYDHTFGSAGDTPRVSELVAEIGDFIDSHTTPDAAFDAEADEDEDGVRGLALREARGQDVRRYEAYHVLRKTGWLIELRDRYRKLVDLSPEGRLLLRELQRIAVGDTRSYGGAVLNVLGNLEQAIRSVVSKAKAINREHGRDLQFVIATNLALADNEILDFCRDNGILISTSLDGPADLHNRNRPRPGGDSYERAIRGIERARSALGRDRVGALMTTTQASLSRVRDIIDEYVRQNFDGIFLRPMSPYGFAVKTKWYHTYDTDAWLDFYFEGLNYILEINRSGHFFAEYYAATILTKMLTPFEPGFVDLRSPAGIGIGAIVYNYDGDVYASDESRMLAEMGDTTFRLGNVNRDNYEDIFLSGRLLGPLEESFAGSAPMCSDCAFEPYCGADPVFHHATQRGDLVGHKPTSAFCKRNMAIFRRLISLMRSDDETRRTFMRWANLRC